MRFLAGFAGARLMAGVVLGALGSIRAGAAIEWLPASLKEVYHSKSDCYCYAPAVVRDGESMHYWFCGNETEGVVRDHIYYLKQTSGSLGALKLALSPASGQAWDSFHVCDAAVVKGGFHFGGSGFAYAMVYLGNNVDASANNEVACSNDPAGAWVRQPQPLVAYPQPGRWGVGQPVKNHYINPQRLNLLRDCGMGH